MKSWGHETVSLKHTTMRHRGLHRRLFTIMVVCASLLPLAISQTNVKCTSTRYQCAGEAGKTNQYYTCDNNNDLVTPAQSCDISHDNEITAVCYPGRPGPHGNPCGPPPPACTADGPFPLPAGVPPTDSCRNYIVCTPASGGGFTQSVGTCPTGQEFSPSSRYCTAIASAGCSVPTTTVPPPSTNPTGTVPTGSTQSTGDTTQPTVGTTPPTVNTTPPTVGTTQPPGGTTQPPDGTTQPGTSQPPGGTTQPPDPTATPGTTTSAPRCTPFRRRPDNNSCTRYFRCLILGIELRLKCPFGKRFSIPANKCVSSAVDCGTRPLN